MTLMLPVVIFFLVYLIYRVTAHIYRQYTSPLWLIPGKPLTRPLSGDLGEHAEREFLIEEILQKHVTEFGSIYRSWHSYGRIKVQLADPDWIKHVLVSKASLYPRGDYLGLEALEILAGERNMISISGEYHKRLRRIATPGFRPAAIQACTRLVEGKAELMQKGWVNKIAESENGKVTIKIQDELTHFTLDCLGVATMDLDFDSLRGGSDFTHTILKVVRSAAFSSVAPFIPFRKALFRKLHSLVLSDSNIDWIPPDKNGLSLANIQHLVQKIRAKILGCSTADTSTKCLLQTILSSNVKGALTQDEMIDLLIIFLLAGTETSSLGLTWTLWLLAEHQEIQNDVAEECSEYLKTGGAMSWGDVTDEQVLSLTKRVLRESMRLYPPVPFLSRVSTKDDVIAGYTVPAGTEIILNIIGMHRNPAIWGDDVTQFKPDREFREDAFLPFGDGTHKCIGYQLATVEMTTALVYLLSKFTFKRLPGDTTKASSVITLVPKPAIQLTVEMR